MVLMRLMSGILCVFGFILIITYGTCRAPNVEILTWHDVDDFHHVRPSDQLALRDTVNHEPRAYRAIANNNPPSQLTRKRPARFSSAPSRPLQSLNIFKRTAF